MDDPRQQGYQINRKLVRRVMQKMGLAAVYPRQYTHRQSQRHTIYPYWLQDVEIIHPHQVWSANVTYVPLIHSFMYLVAILD